MIGLSDFYQLKSFVKTKSIKALKKLSRCLKEGIIAGYLGHVSRAWQTLALAAGVLAGGGVGALAVVSAVRPVLAAPAGRAAGVAHPARAAHAGAVPGVAVREVLAGANLEI